MPTAKYLGMNGPCAPSLDAAACPSPVDYDGLLRALADHWQIDEDGTSCGVSRQAVCEAIDIIKELRGDAERFGKLVGALYMAAAQEDRHAFSELCPAFSVTFPGGEPFAALRPEVRGVATQSPSLDASNPKD